MVRGLSKQFYHQTVTTEQIEDYMSKACDRDLKPFFNQYLRDVRIPVFEYKLDKDILRFRWNNCVQGFDMPLKISVNSETRFVYPTTEWKQVKINNDAQIVADKNFYVQVKNLGTP